MIPALKFAHLLGIEINQGNNARHMKICTTRGMERRNHWEIKHEWKRHQRHGEMALNRQLLLGRLENEVTTVNKRSDYKGTFRHQECSETRKYKLFFCHQEGDKIEAVGSYMTENSGIVFKTVACLTSSKSSSSKLFLISGNVDPGYQTFQFNSNWTLESFFMKFK